MLTEKIEILLNCINMQKYLILKMTKKISGGFAMIAKNRAQLKAWIKICQQKLM